MRVWYNGITSDFQSDDFSSILNTRSSILKAGVAQLVEQHICNVQVAGSSPITSSNVDGSSTGRAPVCGTGCCEFEPRPSTQIVKLMKL